MKVEIKNKKFDLVLSDSLIDFLEENIPSFKTLDFEGYIINCTSKRNYKPDVGMAVRLDGTFTLFSLNVKKPLLSERKAEKTLKLMYKMGALKDKPAKPFPEFKEKYENLKEGKRIIKIDDYFFLEKEEYSV